jgi:hypothetical protein
VKVEFRAVGGSVEIPSTMTNSEGIASAGTWQFSKVAGESRVEVWSGDSVRISFVATLTPDSPREVRLLSDENPGELTTGSYCCMRFRVEDRFANPVPGIPVKVEATDGHLTSFAGSSDMNGEVKTSAWSLIRGINRMTVTVDGLSARTFTAVGLDSSDFRFYDLIVARANNNAPLPFQFQPATLALTQFDACLCRSQTGYFIDQYELQFFGGVRHVGHYELNADRLVLSGSSGSGSISGDSVRVVRTTSSIAGSTTATWIYHMIRRN